jgi:SAM-dependent methyltransferase
MAFPRDLTPVAERFSSITTTVLDAKDLPVDPWFYRYCGNTQSPAGADRYVRHRADFMRLGWPSTGAPVVVDAGSGFGFTLVVAALFGASRVYGIELNPSMVETFRAYEPLLPADVRERVEVAQGNVTEMPYEAGSADLVLSIEAISHYLDVDAFIAESRRVLRQGGMLVISDGNNGSNPKIRKLTHEIWEASERGSGAGEVHGHALGTPYEQVRADLLAERFAEIDAGARAQLAHNTAGYTESRLFEAAQAYLRDGTLPVDAYRPGELAAAPDGTVNERLFFPHALARDLRKAGFEARAYGYWGGAGGAPWVRMANRALSALSAVTMPTAPSFRIVARKR